MIHRVILALLALLVVSAPSHAAEACGELAAPPDSLQVAWVSNLPKRVKNRTWLEVVRLSDLRAWMAANEVDSGADALRLLQGLGMVGRKASVAKEAKITIFDVQSEWLCRPLLDGVPGAELAGVSTCEEPQQGRISGHGRGYTGCGYTLDTGASTRGLEVFRVTWETASAWGFCTMPLSRFLDGA